MSAIRNWPNLSEYIIDNSYKNTYVFQCARANSYGQIEAFYLSDEAPTSIKQLKITYYMIDGNLYPSSNTQGSVSSTLCKASGTVYFTNLYHEPDVEIYLPCIAFCGVALALVLLYWAVFRRFLK